MLNQKNNKGQKNIGDKSKNILPPIGTPNQVNKKKIIQIIKYMKIIKA